MAMIQNEPSKARSPHQLTRGTSLWICLSIAAALIAIAGSVVGLTARPIYSGLTAVFLAQALATAVANLAVASPSMLILAAMALRSSIRAYLLWLGVVTFTIYNYVIYAFSIPFGPLFLLWVGVLGLCLYSLLGGGGGGGRDGAPAPPLPRPPARG